MKGALVRSLAVLAIVPATVLGQAAPGDTGEAASPMAPVGRTNPCVVTRISDGDTLRCRQGRENLRVRLTGIDAPEMADSTHGPRSARALSSMASVGDTILLELDVQPRDQYRRVLAYAWRNGSLLNLRMVREGWAVPYTVPPNVRYEATFRAAQRSARADGAGHWKTNGFACTPAEFRRGACGQ